MIVKYSTDSIHQCVYLGGLLSGLEVRRAKSAAKNPNTADFWGDCVFCFVFFGLRFFELDLVGWCAMSATRVLHEGC